MSHCKKEDKKEFSWKGFWERHRSFICPLLFAIPVAAIILFFESCFPSIFHQHASLAYLTAALVAATGVLAWVASRELRALKKASEKSKEQLEHMSSVAGTDFLLRIDKRYCSAEMLQARTIIQALYCDAKLKGNRSIVEHQQFIGQAINDIGSKKEKSNDFMCLVNFLDFLETIAYLANEERHIITQKDIEELLGGSIVWYYEIFRPLILYRRHKYLRPEWYCQLEKLCSQLTCQRKNNGVGAQQ